MGPGGLSGYTSMHPSIWPFQQWVPYNGSQKVPIGSCPPPLAATFGYLQASIEQHTFNRLCTLCILHFALYYPIT